MQSNYISNLFTTMVNLMNFKEKKDLMSLQVRDYTQLSDFECPSACFLLGRVVTLVFLQTTTCSFLTLKAEWYKVLVRFWSTKTWREGLAKVTYFTLVNQGFRSLFLLLLSFLVRLFSLSLKLVFLFFAFSLSKLSLFFSLSLSHGFFSQNSGKGKRKWELKSLKSFYT